MRLSLFLFFVATFSTGCQHKQLVPVDIVIDDYIMRSGDRGDNWCLTWGEDGALYTNQCDGRGWKNKDGSLRDYHNNVIWRITGGPDTITFSPAPIEYPDYSRSGYTEIYGPIIPPDTAIKFVPAGKLRDGWNWYGYGLISIEGNLFQFISHCGERYGWGWFDGSQLIWRPEGDKKWIRWNGTDAHDRDRWLLNKGGNQLMFFNEQDLAFSFISVVQYGQDYTLNKDDYVYIYSPEGKARAANLNLARVPKDEITNRSKWEYFVQHNENGGAEWAKGDITKRGIVHQFPKGWGFYSWLPSVVWNEKLDLFIMATGGTQPPGSGDPLSSSPHIKSGSLMFLWSKNPWGPWTQFFHKEEWKVGEDMNRTYLPQLSPKWISEDGTEMYVVFSDAGKSHGPYYKWNMVKIKIALGRMI